MKKKNLYENIPEKLPKELFNKIIYGNSIKIWRIVSKNHRTPKNKWYNQNKNEFVVVIKGSAELSFKENNKIKKLKMKKGDCINIPPRLKHRVDKTDKETIWLAVFY